MEVDYEDVEGQEGREAESLEHDDDDIREVREGQDDSQDILDSNDSNLNPVGKDIKLCTAGAVFSSFYNNSFYCFRFHCSGSG